MLDEQEQLAVIHGLREGSRDSWATLYDSYSVDVWRYVARLLGPDPAAVADVVQEAFLEAVQSARQFDPGRGTLSSWLVGIAHHRVSAYWRQASRQARLQHLAESGEIDIRHLFDGELVTKTAGEAHDIGIFVRSVLAELSSDYASLLTAKYLNGQSLDEIATQIGGSVEAIKSKLARARHEFRSKFEFMTKAAEPPANRTVAEKRP